MITRDVDAGAVADLALAPPRAALASVVDDEILLLSVEVTLDDPSEPADSTRVVRVPDNTPDLSDHDVVVIADDGPQWFRLRSLTVRGTATAVGDQAYRLAPRRVVAWDYGALRDVPEAAPERSRPLLPREARNEPEPLLSPKLTAALSNCDVMIVATRSRKGTPFAVPLWFLVRDGRIYASTSASSWTVRNVTACPEVCVMLGGERGQGSERLLVRGHAQAVGGMPPAAVLARTAWRYYLRPPFAANELRHIGLWGRRFKYYSQSAPAHIVITPQGLIEC